MRAIKMILLGLLGGAALAGAAGIAMPETRAQPIAIGIIAVCGAFFGMLIGFAAHMLTRSEEERGRETQADVVGAAKGRGGIVGGAAVVILAIVWFFIGLAAGRVYIYPPVLLVLGLVSIARGMIGRGDSNTA